MTDDVMAFIEARLVEIERLASAVDPRSDVFNGSGIIVMHLHGGGTRSVTLNSELARYLLDRNPTGVLRDVAATRELIARALRYKHREVEDCWYSCPKSEGGCCNEDEPDECTCWVEPVQRDLLRLIASRWSAHPDYREEWRP